MTTTKKAAAIGIYSSTAARTIKAHFAKEKTLHCSTYEDQPGVAYVSNGHYMLKLDPVEYDALIRPVAQRDAGCWSYRNGNFTDAAPAQFDALTAWKNFVEKPKLSPISPAPLIVTAKNGVRISTYYNAAADAVIGLASDYAEMIHPAAKVQGSTPHAAVVVLGYDDEPAAFILPVNMADDGPTKATRAYFAPAGEDAAEELRNARRAAHEWEMHAHAVEKDLATAQAKADHMTQKAQDLESLMTTQRAAYADMLHQLQDRPAADEMPQAQPQPAAVDAAPAPSKAEELKAQLDKMGIAWTVKGERTAAPILWTEGNPQDHAEELKAAGMTYAAKRDAWYAKI